MALLGGLSHRSIELRLSRLIGVQKLFQKAARSRFKVFAIKRYFPPPLTLLGSKPAKHHSIPMASQLGQHDKPPPMTSVKTREAGTTIAGRLQTDTMVMQNPSPQMHGILTGIHYRS